MAKRNFKKIMSDSKLRATLLRIWFVKNLTVFLKVFFFVSIVLVFTGTITEETAILGVIFGPLSEQINMILYSSDVYTNSNLMDAITVVLTLLITVGTFSSRLKYITLADIKNIKVKRAMVQAGLYFNNQGRLTKRAEEISKIDLNGDGLIGDTELTPESFVSEPLFQGVKRSFSELKTVMTASIESEKEIQEIIEDAGLEEAQGQVEDIKETIADSLDTKITEEVFGKIEENIEEEHTRKSVKAAFIDVKNRTKDLIKKIFTRKLRVKEVEEEIIEAPEPVQETVAVSVIAQVQPKKLMTPAERLAEKFKK